MNPGCYARSASRAPMTNKRLAKPSSARPPTVGRLDLPSFASSTGSDANDFFDGPPRPHRPERAGVRDAHGPRVEEACATIVARRYRIQSTLGTGGMGVVYGAVDLTTGAEVAVKLLGASTATTQNVRRFRREAATAASVTNKHCCRILGAGIDGGQPYIVMERLEGETLRRRMLDTGALAAPDAVSVMLQILDGLAAAHEKGVIHRDVKPGNIFITSPRDASPSIKIIDFGLAKLMPNAWKPAQGSRLEETSTITTTDVVPGTPMYLAPEQLRGLRDLDGRIDVWAAGVTFYEMLTNQRAFTGATYMALASSIVA